jgi:uncharacterized protein
MKYLLLLAVVLLAAWLWRSQRGALPDSKRSDAAAPGPGQDPQTMVVCAHCGVHLPQAEAVTGRLGWYCSAQHRQLAEP